MSELLDYPSTVIPPFRFQFCPMCKTPLIRKVLFDDNIPLVTCPACRWIYTHTNVMGVLSVATCAEGIVAILPPHLASDASPAALPGGLIEYGESPEEAAMRETREETGLETEIVRSLGWSFFPNFAGWPGPMVHFFFETRIIGGTLKGSDEGQARIFPRDAFPEIISPQRSGSMKAIRRYLGLEQ